MPNYCQKEIEQELKKRKQKYKIFKLCMYVLLIISFAGNIYQYELYHNSKKIISFYLENINILYKKLNLYKKCELDKDSISAMEYLENQENNTFLELNKVLQDKNAIKVFLDIQKEIE